jgi:hypothetical protein
VKTVKITAFVYELDFGHGDGPEFRVFNSDTQGDKWYTLVGPVEIEYEIPDSFNPTASKLAQLEKEKAAVRAEYLARVREIEERISKLQALEMTVEA